MTVGFFGWLKGEDEPKAQVRQWPELGSVLDSVPAVDARALFHIEWWVNRWFDVVATHDNDAMGEGFETKLIHDTP